MLYWLIPVWAISLIGAFSLGYFVRGIMKKLAELEQAVHNKVDIPVEEEPKSMLIDPLDPIQEAIYEREKLMKKLNPPS